MNSHLGQDEREQERNILYSRTARYAIQAFVHLAQLPKGGFATNKDIAAAENLPSPHLSKILQFFARTGLLRSMKGPTGGFALDIDPSQIRLLDIVGPLDGLIKFRRCATGLVRCSDDMPCSMHDGWLSLRSQIIGYLESSTIADLAPALEQKRKNLASRRPKSQRRARRRTTTPEHSN